MSAVLSLVLTAAAAAVRGGLTFMLGTVADLVIVACDPSLFPAVVSGLRRSACRLCTRISEMSICPGFGLSVSVMLQIRRVW